MFIKAQVEVILLDFNLEEIWNAHKPGADEDEEERKLIKQLEKESRLV